jgi:hypothetical protein
VDGVLPPVQLDTREGMSLLYVLVDRIQNLEDAALVSDIHGHEETIARSSAQRGIETPQSVEKGSAPIRVSSP